MKEELINKLFEEFEKDKDIIKLNLLKVMDTIMLETENEFGKLSLIIKYERKENNKKQKEED